jgi:hypothetical protein
VEEVVAELHRFGRPFGSSLRAICSLSRTYVHVHDPDDLLMDDSPAVDQSRDPFLRLNFEYEVKGIDEFLVKAEPSQPTPTHHKLNILAPARPLTTSEQAAQKFFDESGTWTRAWKPKDTRRVAKKRRRDDEEYFSPGSADSYASDELSDMGKPQNKKIKL